MSCPRYIELGNEQLDTKFVAQVQAMEARAAAIGKPKFFYYISPNQGRWLPPDAADAIETLDLGKHVLSDIHVDAGGGIAQARALFGRFPNKTFGAANAETNDGHHTMARASKEAADLNVWYSCADAQFCSRLLFRTASFCAERSGHLDVWDQGISMFLPNMSWLQPPGYVHAMHADTWQRNGLRADIHALPGAHAANVSVSAQQSDDGKTLAVRLANTGNHSVTISLESVTTGGWSRLGFVSNATLHLLASPTNNELDANTPGEPTRVSPVISTMNIGNKLVLPPVSAAVVVMKKEGDLR